jgi:hypothetical protein
MKNAMKLLMAMMLIQAGLFLAGMGKAQAFEGTVDYHVKAGDHESDIEYIIKGTKLRFNVSQKAHAAAGIVDLTAKTMIILMPQQKMYMSQPFPDYKKVAEASKGKFSKTGNTETILGHTCDEYVYTTENGAAHVWLAKGIGMFQGLFQNKPTEMDSWVTLVKSKGLFPLKSSYQDKDGKEKSSMVATKLSKEAVDDSVFVPPADYKEMKMPAVDLGQLAPNMSGVKIPGF